MVDITVTPADVIKVSGNQRTGIAGVAITAGDSVYIDSDDLVQLAENAVTSVEADCVGIAICDAAVDQPVIYQISGEIDIGGTVVVGRVYAVGAAGGGISPEVDIGTGDFMTTLGIAITTTNIKIGINPSGVAAA